MPESAIEELFRGHSILIYNPQDTLSDFHSVNPSGGEPVWADKSSTPSPIEKERDDMLMINGKAIPYTKDATGYYIYYQSVEQNLLDAARSYLETQSEASE